MTGDQRVCLRQVAPPGSEKGQTRGNLCVSKDALPAAVDVATTRRKQKERNLHRSANAGLSSDHPLRLGIARCSGL